MCLNKKIMYIKFETQWICLTAKITFRCRTILCHRYTGYHRMQRGEDGEDVSYLHTVVDPCRPVAVIQLDIGQRPSSGRPAGSELYATALDAILAFLEPIQEHS